MPSGPITIFFWKRKKILFCQIRILYGLFKPVQISLNYTNFRHFHFLKILPPTVIFTSYILEARCEELAGFFYVIGYSHGKFVVGDSDCTVWNVILRGLGLLKFSS